MNACFNHTCEFIIDFSNGYAISPYENLTPSCIIGLRLFHCALVDDFTPFVDFVNSNFDRVRSGEFTVPKVMQAISNVYRKLLDIQDNTPLPLVIIMDEYQETIQGVLKEHKQWKEIAKSIGNYMCSVNPNTMLSRDKILAS